MAQESTPAVRLVGIRRQFPRVLACDDVALEVRRGEIHALVGENGAGKSTLMQIIYGRVRPDRGVVEVHGRPLTRHTPQESIAAGVGMVFQHFMLVPSLTVAENLVLGAEPTRRGLLDRAAAREQAMALADRYGLAVDPDARIADCTVGQQQRVEILKVLHRGADVIIFDEPTAVLTPAEIDDLLEVMRRLAAANKTILFVSHKLREVLAVADRVTVLRHGAVVAREDAANTTPDALAEHMVGRRLASLDARPGTPGDDVTLRLRDLHDRAGAFHGIDLAVRGGEIVGLAGVEGNGQMELLDAIVGARSTAHGTITLAGHDVTRANVRKRLQLGMAHIPADRHARAVVLPMNVTENVLLGRQHEAEFGGRSVTPGRVRWSRVRAHAEAIIGSCDVRPPDPDHEVASLSGGNQQKVVIGRELGRSPRLVVAAHPTRGLDVGAARFTLQSLLEERERGAAVLFASAELGELLQTCDRILVLFRGRVAGEVHPENSSERELGMLMTAGSVGEVSA